MVRPHHTAGPPLLVDEMVDDDAAAPLPQATQMYGAAHDDVDEEAGADEAVRRAPSWHATQQYGWSQEGDDEEHDDDEAVRRSDWLDAPMAESPRALAARWAACGLEMDDELSGEPSMASEDGVRMSEMVSGELHAESVCSMDVVAEVYAQDAEREQQSERVSVECVGRADDGAGGVSIEARRGHEGEGGVEGCEGVDGVEQGASMAAREVEGDDEDEDMAGVENISMQRAEGGGGTTGGIKKGKRTRGKRNGNGHRQWLASRGADLRSAADVASGS